MTLRALTIPVDFILPCALWYLKTVFARVFATEPRAPLCRSPVATYGVH
jgi:hypothetical protein